MTPFLVANQSEIALLVDGDVLRCDTARFSTPALLDAYTTLGSVVMRRLQDVRATAPGDVAGGNSAPDARGR
jgi:hypothetical protein